MIIYRKSDETVVIPCGLGHVVCPDSSYELQMKQVDSSTMLQHVEPDSGYYGLSRVIINPYTVESKSQTITQNGTYSFAPTTADALSDVDISVEVAGTPAMVQAKSVSYNANGEYTVAPDQGYDGLSSVDISVNVPTPAPALQTKTVNSSTANQTVTPDQGYDGLSEVDINALTDPNLVSNNIKKDVTIFGITGSFNGDPQLQQKTVNSSTASQTVQSDGGYDGLSKVIVNPYTVESNSSTLTQNGTYTITPASADALSSVTVNVSVNSGANLQTKSVTANTTFPATILPDTGYDGFSRLDIDIQGVDYKINSIQSNSSVSNPSTYNVYAYVNKMVMNPIMTDEVIVNPSTNQQVITPSRDAINQVTVNAVTSSIDSNILPENIKYGVTILGVQGTYIG